MECLPVMLFLAWPMAGDNNLYGNDLLQPSYAAARGRLMALYYTTGEKEEIY